MLPGIVGLIQATEVIKLILQRGSLLIGRLLLYDAMKMTFKEVRIQKDLECVLCGDKPSVKDLINYKEFCDLKLQKIENIDEIDERNYELTPGEFKNSINKDPSAVLVDVRESSEWDICKIRGAKLIPLSVLDPTSSGLNPKDSLYLYCYKGKRSIIALKKLRKAGFKKIKYLKGGIDLWAEEVDPDMPKY